MTQITLKEEAPPLFTCIYTDHLCTAPLVPMSSIPDLPEDYLFTDQCSCFTGQFVYRVHLTTESSLRYAIDRYFFKPSDFKQGLDLSVEWDDSKDILQSLHAELDWQSDKPWIICQSVDDADQFIVEPANRIYTHTTDMIAIHPMVTKIRIPTTSFWNDIYSEHYDNHISTNVFNDTKSCLLTSLSHCRAAPVVTMYELLT